jgi:hypothetical protein
LTLAIGFFVIAVVGGHPEIISELPRAIMAVCRPALI